jgi:hypothetical protein
VDESTLAYWGDKRDFIEGKKLEIAKLDDKNRTRWAYFKTPQQDEVYWWCDNKGESYAWTFHDGKPTSEPQQAKEAMEMIEKVRKYLGIPD